MSGFSQDSWKKRFYVCFEGESGRYDFELFWKIFFVGIDAGGVTREFFTCLCEALFDGKDPKGLFSKFKDDPQALVAHHL